MQPSVEEQVLSESVLEAAQARGEDCEEMNEVDVLLKDICEQGRPRSIHDK